MSDNSEAEEREYAQEKRDAEIRAIPYVNLASDDKSLREAVEGALVELTDRWEKSASDLRAYAIEFDKCKAVLQRQLSYTRVDSAENSALLNSISELPVV